MCQLINLGSLRTCHLQFIFLFNCIKTALSVDLLGQDIFLLGRPGPLRRLLAQQYLQLTDREMEYVALSRDTTESDLKQRREITAGTAAYLDQAAVKAATLGRVLVLEGIEKVERNVLPVLNNLLENREMHLEDGRLLIPAGRYDGLLAEHGQEVMDKWRLVRVSEDFRVIALGRMVFILLFSCREIFAFYFLNIIVHGVTVPVPYPPPLTRSPVSTN
jgi:hypothetical protein